MWEELKVCSFIFHREDRIHPSHLPQRTIGSLTCYLESIFYFVFDFIYCAKLFCSFQIITSIDQILWFNYMAKKKQICLHFAHIFSLFCLHPKFSYCSCISKVLVQKQSAVSLNARCVIQWIKFFEPLDLITNSILFICNNTTKLQLHDWCPLTWYSICKEIRCLSWL